MRAVSCTRNIGNLVKLCSWSMQSYRGRRVFPGGSKKRYPSVYWPDHQKATANGCVYVHQDVALGKFGDIPDGMGVHHVDENVWNWNPGNIELMGRSEHAVHHARELTVYPPRTCEWCGGDVAVHSQKRSDQDVVCCSTEHSVRLRGYIDWPDVGDLVEMVGGLGYVGAGRALGVSDNAVRKRIRTRRKEGIS